MVYLILYKGGVYLTDTRPFPFSKWLHNEMEECGMSTYKLAEETGMSRQTIIFYLKGERSPSIVSLEVILKVFKKHIKIVDD